MILIGLIIAVATCSDGSVPYKDYCAQVEAKTETIVIMPVSNEKPSRHPESAWQRGEVTADTPPSLIASDEKLDQEKAQATFEGKKAAGLR